MPIRELKFRIRVVVEPDDDAGLYAYCPDLNSIAVEGRTMDEVKESMRCAITSYLESLIKHNDPIPLGLIETDETHEVMPFLWKKLSERLGLAKHSEYIQDVPLLTGHNHAPA